MARNKKKKRGLSAAARDVLRSVGRSKSRFFAIFGIVALGAGFFCGLLSCGPDMRDTVDSYYDETYMMDIQIASTLGLTEEDAAAVAEIDGVEGVMPGYQLDSSVVFGEEELTARFHSLPEDLLEENSSYLNRPVLIEGRWPQSNDECVLGLREGDDAASILGQTITVTEDGLKEKELTVVGLVKTSYYLSFTIGSTAIGNGQLDLYAYVPETAFDQEAYTSLFLSVNDAKELNSFGKDYEALVDEVQDRLETVGEERAVLRTEEVKADALTEVEDGQEELDDQRAQAEEELQEAAQKLEDSQKQIDDGLAELESGQQALEEGRAQLEESQQQINDGLAELESAQEELDQGRAEYQSQLEAFERQKQEAQEGFAQAHQELDDRRAQLEEGRTQLEAAKAQLEETANQIAAMEEQLKQLEQAGMTEEAEALRQQIQIAQQAWEQASAQVQEEEQTLLQGEAALEAGEQQLAEEEAQVNAQLEEGQSQLDAAAAELEAGQAEIDENRATLEEGQQEINSGLAELEENQQTLDDSRQELEDGQEELAQGRAEYESQKADAEQQLADAQQELDDARQEIEDIEDAEWYVLDRGGNAGYVSFKNDANRMDALSTVFPVIFFLVAALVALTTMTRMVEEERVIIGTYKALGYTKGRIAFKYLFYAGAATLAGCIIGPIIGFKLLPWVVWDAYRIVYAGPDMIPPYRINYALIAAGVLLACTLGATFSACWSSLREQPARLMLPKAPKAGKRIWLERIKPVWKRLSFTHKVTARNLFLYKRRLLMTIAGIAGCTALLVTGFGVRDSISDILDIQYGELYRYDTTITLEDGTDPEEVRPLVEQELETPVFAVQKSAEVTEADGDSLSVYVQSPQDCEAFTQLVDFRTRQGHNPVSFDENSVILSEKLANQAGVSVGDTLRVNVDDRWQEVTVTGITEQYVYHYIYMGPKAYEDAFGSQEFNQVLGVCPGEDREAVSEALLDNDHVNTVSFSEDTEETFGSMLGSMDLVVLILIFCAGMLAFIVLYNLTNINITERQREIATIKVLGFYDREVSMYVYRETIMLTLMGCLIGLLLGIVLHIFVIDTVEVDMVMFGRSIKPLSYVWSFLLTMVFSFLVNLVMEKKLRNVSMVESLKSVD